MLRVPWHTRRAGLGKYAGQSVPAHPAAPQSRHRVFRSPDLLGRQARHSSHGHVRQRQVGSRPKTLDRRLHQTHQVPAPARPAGPRQEPLPRSIAAAHGQAKILTGRGGRNYRLAPSRFHYVSFVSELRTYWPASFRSSLACRSASFAAPLASASGFSRRTDLVRLWAFSPMGPLQPDRSTLVCTPVTSARTQLKSIPRFLLAWSDATHSSSAIKSAHASVTLALAANSPCAWNLGVSFFSISLRDSVDFLESFLTHLMGLRECPLCDDVSFAAADAPAPAGPCAVARPAPTVKLSDKIKTTMTARKQCLFMFTPLVNTLRFDLRLPDPTSTSVGHSVLQRIRFGGRVLPQSVTLAVRTGAAFADKKASDRWR